MPVAFLRGLALRPNAPHMAHYTTTLTSGLHRFFRTRMLEEPFPQNAY